MAAILYLEQEQMISQLTRRFPSASLRRRELAALENVQAVGVKQQHSLHCKLFRFITKDRSAILQPCAAVTTTAAPANVVLLLLWSCPGRFK